MDQAVWLAIVAVLALALMFARRAARARRKRLAAERERARRKRPKYKPRPMSDRTEMRAYDDPSTLADITHARQPQHDAESAGDDCAGIASPRWFGGWTQAVRQAGARAALLANGPGRTENLARDRLALRLPVDAGAKMALLPSLKLKLA